MVEPILDVCFVVPIKRPKPPPTTYVWVLPQGARNALEVQLDHDDGERRWGSTHDARGNRIEVHVYDGDPYQESP